MRSVLRYAINMSAAAALLTACGGSQLPLGVPRADSALTRAPGTSNGYNIVYDFDLSKGTGTEPLAAPLIVGRDIYASTSNDDAYGGAGALDRVTEKGAETTLHVFRGRRDGFWPQGSLIDVHGTFYGTTRNGGGGNNPLCEGPGCGTVFSLSPSGSEKVLHRFDKPNDGAQPTGRLLYYTGEFYGTASLGGTDNEGIVFTLSPAGKERILHNFTGFKDQDDGAEPAAGFVQLDGALYGTTASGGKYHVGTIYKVTPSGTVSIVYSFKGPPNDGAYPKGDLTIVNGNLYGTSSLGGIEQAGTCYNGCGTVFSVSTSGQEHVLHRFAPTGDDGNQPMDVKLVYAGGTLYGTTSSGGKHGLGTVFAITLGGKERVLHDFGGDGLDGWEPYAGVVLKSGKLYGTTRYGGRQDGGIIYSVTP